MSALLVAPAAVKAGDQHSHPLDVVISSNQEFDRAHGVSSGRGTKASPYVFKGLSLNSLEIRNTSKAIKIVDSAITRLTLNYIGPMVEVVDNSVEDLRVNENVPRTGAPTSGRFISNFFGLVGQIRHFDGRFAYNTVGRPSGNFFDGFFFNQSVTFDGFNGALFDHNLIYGSMESRLHGHHHSSSFGSTSHMHQGHHADMVDHTVRYHQVRIFANTIHAAPGAPYALTYTDTNHAGNDRTAPSETNPDLEKAHLHRTKVAIAGNTLTGSGLLVDVFNAEDEIHKGMPQGWLSITENRISIERSDMPFFGRLTGISILRAEHLAVRIGRNSITGPPPMSSTSPLKEFFGNGEGILLDGLDHADVLLDSNAVTRSSTGIRASQMTSTVRWTVRGLRTSGVQEPVAYDNSVENPPRG